MVDAGAGLWEEHVQEMFKLYSWTKAATTLLNYCSVYSSEWMSGYLVYKY